MVVREYITRIMLNFIALLIYVGSTMNIADTFRVYRTEMGYLCSVLVTVLVVIYEKAGL